MNNVENVRPNIRIEIQNNASDAIDGGDEEKMDVSENEEGEIQDSITEEPVLNTGVIRQISIEKSGLDIFMDENDQKKLEERAKRFNLNPDEICNFSEQDFQDLRDSLGITTNNSKEIKFNTLHMIGLGEMATKDIFEYFSNYAPDSIRWIDETSCDVIWLDNLSAARALHFKTRAVKGMPARHTKDVFPREFLDEVDDIDELPTGESILIKNKNRQIELQNEIGEVIQPTIKKYLRNAIDIAEITIPIPPGYWRLGVPHSKCTCLLIRYGLVSDKIGITTEKFSKYYKNLSNPKMSEIKKKELQSIFERNKELNQERNPWGSLAENWDSDSKFRERYQSNTHHQLIDKSSVLSGRLGFKRKHNNEKEIIEEQNDEEPILKDVIIKQAKKKVPIMRMYADEEEENIKRKRLLQKLKKQEKNIESSDRDLRSILSPKHRHFTAPDDNKDPDETADLALKLRNRQQKMIFAIERDLFNPSGELPASVPNRNKFSSNSRERGRLYSDENLSAKRISSKKELNRWEQEKEKSHSVKIPNKTLHSDRIDQGKLSTHSGRYHGRLSPIRSRTGDGKPRSKVAVVIKTQKKPTVASTVWSRSKKSNKSDRSSSSSESEEGSESDCASSSSSDNKSESNENSDSTRDSPLRKRMKNYNNSTFDKRRLMKKFAEKSSNLKVTMKNDRYRTD